MNINWGRQLGILCMAAIFAIYWTGKQVPCGLGVRGLDQPCQRGQFKFDY